MNRTWTPSLLVTGSAVLIGAFLLVGCGTAREGDGTGADDAGGSGSDAVSDVETDALETLADTSDTPEADEVLDVEGSDSGVFDDSGESIPDGSGQDVHDSAPAPDVQPDLDAEPGDGPTLDVVPADVEPDTTPDADEPPGHDVSDPDAEVGTDVVDADAAPEPAPPTLRALAIAVLLPKCGGGSCHLDGANAGELSLDFDAGLRARLLAASTVDLPLVVPGDVEASYLWHKVVGTHREVGGSGSRMPLGGFPLTGAGLETLRSWIEGGALE